MTRRTLLQRIAAAMAGTVLARMPFVGPAVEVESEKGFTEFFVTPRMAGDWEITTHAGWMEFDPETGEWQECDEGLPGPARSIITDYDPVTKTLTVKDVDDE